MGARGRGARSRARRCRPSEMGVVVAVVPGGRAPPPRRGSPSCVLPTPAPGDVIPWYEDPGPSSAALPIARAEAMPADSPPRRRARPRGRPRARPGGDRPTPRARRRRPQSASDATRNRPGRHPKAPSDRTPRTRRDEPAAKAGEGPENDPGAATESARRLRSAASSSASSRSSASAAASLASAPRVRAPRAPGRRATTAEANRAWARPPRAGVRARLAARRPHGAQRRRVRGDGAARARARPARVDPDLLEGARRSFSDDVANNTSAARAAAAARVPLAPARARAQRRRGARRARGSRRSSASTRTSGGDVWRRSRRRSGSAGAEAEAARRGRRGADGALPRVVPPPPRVRSPTPPRVRSPTPPRDRSPRRAAAASGLPSGAEEARGIGPVPRSPGTTPITSRRVGSSRPIARSSLATTLGFSLAHNPGGRSRRGGVQPRLRRPTRAARDSGGDRADRRWCNLVGVPRRGRGRAPTTSRAS